MLESLQNEQTWLLPAENFSFPFTLEEGSNLNCSDEEVNIHPISIYLAISLGFIRCGRYTEMTNGVS